MMMTAIQTLKTIKLPSEDKVIYDDDGNPDTKNDQITVNGNFKLDPNIDFVFDMGWFELDELLFKAELNQTSEINVKSTLTLLELHRDNATKELAELKLKPFTIMVGFVPLVFETTITINIGAEGSLKAELTTGVKQELKNGRWRTVHE